MSSRYKAGKVVVTIGIFDGIHLAHQKILRKLISESRRENAKSAVVTFDPHPRKILNPAIKTPLLISLKHRMKLIKAMGVDDCLVIKFTRRFSKIAPKAFVEKILLKQMKLKAVIVGENFLFGFRKKGSIDLLKTLSKARGFKLHVVKPFKMKGDYVSSTRIRQAIEKGDLKLASSMLGRPVSVLGTVIKGRGLGRRLGFPTANINPHHEAIPPSGVYAVDAVINGKSCKGILNIGIRPTLGIDKEPSIEIHIFNFKKDIYGRDMEIIFRRKIRGEKKFKSLSALQNQIRFDIIKAS